VLDRAGLDRVDDLGATPRTVLWPNPTMTLPPSVSSANPSIGKRLLDDCREVVAVSRAGCRELHRAAREEALLYSSRGGMRQLVVMRIAPGNAANSLCWFCHAVP
jgi:hypothetical protein